MQATFSHLVLCTLDWLRAWPLYGPSRVEFPVQHLSVCACARKQLDYPFVILKGFCQSCAFTDKRCLHYDELKSEYPVAT